MTTGDPMVVVDGLVKRYDARTVLDGVSLTIRGGELVALLGPNGAGKTTTVEIVEGYRRGDGGSVRVLGHRPGGGRTGAPGTGRADAPGRRHRPARPAARDAPPVRPLPRRPTRRRRAARPGRAGRRRADALPASVGRRATAARAGARARRPARGRHPRRADGRDGPGGPCHDPGDRRGPARQRRRGPADEPRPDRRRAAGRSDLRPRRRPDRRVGDARRAARRGDAATPVPARPGAVRRRVGGVGRARWRRSGRAHGSCPMATAPAIDSTAPSRTPRSWPRSPAGRATADRLIVELRTAGGSLEDVYLELVGAGRVDEAVRGDDVVPDDGARRADDA